MKKKEIEIKKKILLDSTFIYNQLDSYNHDLIKKIDNIKVKGSLSYNDELKCVLVNATVIADIVAIDARDGKIFEKKEQKYDWIDEYFFENTNDDQHNIVLGDSFDIKEYAIEQIVLNIPLNFTNNCGKISFVGKDFRLMSEEEYEQIQEERVDPRWEVLKDFKIDE